MADDLDKKLKQIADMFGVSDTKNLRNIVESISPPDPHLNQASSSSEPDASYNGNTGYPPSSSPNSRSNGGIDLNFLAKANEMLGMFNNVQDSRITLLNSVQPFLGNQRQQRLSGAIQLLKVLAIINSISPTINRNTKG